MEIKKITDEITYSSRMMKYASFEFIGKILNQLYQNLYTDVVKKATSSSKGMVIFPLEYSVMDNNLSEMGVARGAIKYAELDFPLKSSSPLTGIILEEVLNNVKVEKSDNPYFVSCPHCIAPDFSTVMLREGTMPIKSTYAVTHVNLHPVYNDREFIGAVGRCPVCGKIYVFEGGATN